MIRKAYNLFLDDIRFPEDCTYYKTKGMPSNRAIYTQEEWYIVRSYKEFVDKITKEFIDGKFPAIVSFDHDLADIHYDPATWTESFVYHEETGKDAAKWLVQFCIDNDIDLPECWVHSMNPIGGEGIMKTLNDWNVYQERFKK